MAKKTIRQRLEEAIKDRPKFRPAVAGGKLASGRPFGCGGKVPKKKAR